MATTPTQLPVPSEKPQDLKFNAGKIDEFVTSMNWTYTDRLGNKHYTIEGINYLAQQVMSAFGYITLDGVDFVTGATISTPNEVLFNPADNSYYKWSGSFASGPKVVLANSTPESTGGIGPGKWLNVGDAALRSEIKKLIYETKTPATDDIPAIYTAMLLSGRYLYERGTSKDADGIKVIISGDGSKWEMLPPSKIYASDFCTDTASLQKAYEAATLMEAAFVIDKVFDNLFATTDDPESPGNNAFKSVIRCIDNSVIEFIGDGALKLANQNRPQSNIIYLHKCKNVEIYDPVLVGDRRTNTTIGEQGWGLVILQCENVYVRGGEYSEMFGDGIYIGMKWGTTDGTVPKNVLVQRPVVRLCRRNGIALCSGENVTIENPQVYNTGDYDGLSGTFPKASIDIEPERDEGVAGTSLPRFVNCVITDPYLDGAYTGLELNLFPENLVAGIDIRGTVTLNNITNRGFTCTRVRGGGVGYINIDRILFKTLPSDVAVIEMLGNDRLVVNVGEFIDATTVAAGYRNIRLLPRAYDGNLSNQFKNFSIGRCTSAIASYVLLAGSDLSQYHLDINIGREEDPIKCFLEYTSGLRPASTRGFIGGVATVTTFTFSKVLNSTIVLNHANQDADLLVDATGDFRALKIKRALTASSASRATGVANIKFSHSGADVTQVVSTEFGAWVVIKNNEGAYTEIKGMYGSWLFS